MHFPLLVLKGNDFFHYWTYLYIFFQETPANGGSPFPPNTSVAQWVASLFPFLGKGSGGCPFFSHGHWASKTPLFAQCLGFWMWEKELLWGLGVLDMGERCRQVGAWSAGCLLPKAWSQPSEWMSSLSGTKNCLWFLWFLWFLRPD